MAPKCKKSLSSAFKVLAITDDSADILEAPNGIAATDGHAQKVGDMQNVTCDICSSYIQACCDYAKCVLEYATIDYACKLEAMRAERKAKAKALKQAKREAQKKAEKKAKAKAKKQAKKAAKAMAATAATS